MSGLSRQPSRLTSLIVLILCTICSSQRFQNSSFDAEYAGVSAACGGTLNPQLSCDDVLGEIAWESRYLSTTQLSNLCSTSCIASLQSGRSSIVSACNGPNDVIVDSGVAYPATFVLDHLINAWQTTCRKDASTAQFCNILFQRWLNQSSIPVEAACSDCMLGTEQVALGSPVGYSDNFASEFASATSSCAKTGYAYSTPTSYALNGTLPTATGLPAATCTKAYTVVSGDTCVSISIAKSVSTFGFIYLNSLDAGCTNFPIAGTSLCLPSTCETYTVTANDTCLGIIQQQSTNATIVQLQSWNMNLNRQCSNLQDYANTTICISAPADIANSSPSNTSPVQSTFATAAPLPTDIVEHTNTYCGKYYKVTEGDECGLISTQNGISLQDFYFLNPEVNTNCTNLFLGYSYCIAPVGDITTYANYSGYNPTTGPCATVFAPSSCYTAISTMSSLPFIDANHTFSGPAVPTTTATLPTAFPLAPGTATGCYLYRGYLTSPNATTETKINSCNFLSFLFGTSKTDLLAWNPSLSSSSCALAAGLRYCIQSIDPSVTTTTTSDGPTSTGALVPGPTQTGIIATCKKYVLQKTDVYCQDMANNAGILLSQLYAWNLALNGDCSGLYPGYAYCIGVSTSSSTTVAQPTSTCAGTAPPEQTQAGISCNCNSWVKQTDGVYCYDMAAAAGIPLQTLYDLNPPLRGDCSGLQAGYAYCLGLAGSTTSKASSFISTTSTHTSTAAQPTSTCVGGVAPPEQVQGGISCKCNKWIKQVDGVYCYDMAAAAGIPLQTLYNLNPALNGDCSGLWAGYAYCIAVAA